MFLDMVTLGWRCTIKTHATTAGQASRSAIKIAIQNDQPNIGRTTTSAITPTDVQSQNRLARNADRTLTLDTVFEFSRLLFVTAVFSVV
jgi:hypothetical protein